jgi:hypothetical protein
MTVEAEQMKRIAEVAREPRGVFGWSNQAADEFGDDLRALLAEVEKLKGALNYTDQVVAMLTGEAETRPNGHSKLLSLSSNQWRCVLKAQEKARAALGPSS